MAIIEDLQKLVEFESPSDDLAACRGVVDLAIQIANNNLNILIDRYLDNNDNS
jgi:hypothetical protein